MRDLSCLFMLKRFSRLSVVKIFFLLFFSMATPGWTLETSEYINPALIISFADDLLHQGNYYKAVMEYERFIYFYPKHPDTPKARFNIAFSMKSTGNYTSALKQYKEFLSRYPQHQLADKAKSAIEKIEKQSPRRSQRTQK